MFTYKFKDIVPVQYYEAEDYTFVIDENNDLYVSGIDEFGCFGDNKKDEYLHEEFIQLEIDDLKNFYVNASATMLYMKNDNTVWGWGANGNNNDGLLGLGHNQYQKRPTQINLDNIKNVFMGSSSLFILKNDNTLWACGNNDNGQLGLGNKNDTYRFKQVDISNIGNIKKISVGWSHTIILDEAGCIWASGANGYGQLGLGNTTDATSFTKVSNITDVKDVAAGGNHTLILKNDGTVLGCGLNSYGQLGLGDTTTRSSFATIAINDVKDIACSPNTSYILKNDGTVLGCGINNYGQLGLGDTTTRMSFTEMLLNNVEKIACGWQHIIVKKIDGSVWGTGLSIGLGLSTESGKTLSPIQLNIDNVKDIACGWQSSYVIKNNNTIWGIGNAQHNSLCKRAYSNHMSFTKVNNNVKKIFTDSMLTMILKHDGTVWATGLDWYGLFGLGSDYFEIKEFVKIADNTKDMFTNGETSFLIKNDGTTWVAGYNYSGQAGINNGEDILEYTQINNIDNVKEIKFGTSATYLLQNNGALWVTGHEYYGSLGLGNRDKSIYSFTHILDNVKKIYIGNYYVFVIKDDETIWATGYNYYGQLGIGSSGNYIDKFEQHSKLTNIKDIYCHDNSTMILKNDGTVWACGYNDQGQLGVPANRIMASFIQLPVSNVKAIYGEELNRFVFLCDNNDVYMVGINNEGQMGVGHTNHIDSVTKNELINIDNIEDIFLGKKTTYIKANDGTYFCGDNFYGATGCYITDSLENSYFDEFTLYELPKKINNKNILINKELVRIKKGSNSKNGHGMYLNDNNQLIYIGHNNLGQLGTGDFIDRDNYETSSMENVSHVKAVKNITIIKKDGKYYVTGEGQNEFIEYKFRK